MELSSFLSAINYPHHSTFTRIFTFIMAVTKVAYFITNTAYHQKHKIV